MLTNCVNIRLCGVASHQKKLYLLLISFLKIIPRVPLKIRCMRKAVIYSLFLSCLLSAVSCKSDEGTAVKEPVEDDFFEFRKFNLQPYDLPATIMLPDETANIGASTRPEVVHGEDGFKWEIQVGPNFHLIIDDYGEVRDKVTEFKRELEKLEMFEIKYLENEKDFIVYQRTLKVDGEKAAPSTVGLEHISYHVYGQKMIDGYTYVFRSREEGYPRNIIELMAQSIKSVKEVKSN